MGQQGNRSFEFGRFRMNVAERVLLRDGEVVPLTPKVFDILLTLVENRGQVVSKEELMKRVWPDTFVEEGNLTQNISLLRTALGETPGGAQFSVTVPRRGDRDYRIVDGSTAAHVAPAHVQISVRLCAWRRRFSNSTMSASVSATCLWCARLRSVSRHIPSSSSSGLRDAGRPP